jgi:hypothetical protein
MFRETYGRDAKNRHTISHWHRHPLEVPGDNRQAVYHERRLNRWKLSVKLFTEVLRRLAKSLSKHFAESWFGGYGPIPWPSRSSNLKCLDFFLWGYVKDVVYFTKVDYFPDLRRRITDAVAPMTPEMSAVPPGGTERNLLVPQ